MTGRDELLARGHAAYQRGAWAESFDAFAAADGDQSLAPGDLELLGRAAYMLGRDDDYVAALERAHKAYVADEDLAPAARCTWWIGHNLMFRGEMGKASGWFARGQRLLDQVDGDCVERGYLLIPRWLVAMGSGDWETGVTTTIAAGEIGERFGDVDLIWMARMDQARGLTKLGRIDEAQPLIDEALVTVLAREPSPIVIGIMCCNIIDFCRDALLLRQAREWTTALSQWCDAQPEMIAHLGLCLVHRAEVLQQAGDWTTALDETRRATEQFTSGALNQIACGHAHYRRGELHRLRGELPEAEDAFREATRCGHEPQPGLALLRLAQGNGSAAAAAMRRAITEARDPLDRVRLLPAYVEIALAAGEDDHASAAAKELEDLAASHDNEVVAALAAHATGSVLLEAGDTTGALARLRRALRTWIELDAIHEAARTRVLVAGACRALGDDDTAAFETDAAREAFRRCGAAADLARLDPAPATLPGHLTAREAEVLRLVAGGKTNREIAADLVLSEHTVRRHLQNIFTKLGVSTRTAASAFAFEHDLA